MKKNIEVLADVTLMTLLNKYIDFHRVSIEQIMEAALVPGSKVRKDIEKLINSLDTETLAMALR